MPRERTFRTRRSSAEKKSPGRGAPNTGGYDIETTEDGKNGEDSKMRIGELSERTGASVRSIRHYEKAGLLGADRQDNGYRSFRDGDVERVSRIRTFLSIGLTVDDVLELHPCLEEAGEVDFLCAEAARLYRSKLAEVEARIRDLEKAKAILVEHVRAAEGSSAEKDSFDR